MHAHIRSTVRHVPDDDVIYLPVLGRALGEPLGAWTTGEVIANHLSGWQVITKWDVVGSRAEPTELRLLPPRGKSVSTDQVRRLPLGRILAGSRQALTNSARMVGQLPQLGGVAPEFTAARPQRGRRLGRDALEEVARVYREAWLLGRPVNEAVREAFTLSRDGAAKRIVAARRAGLLDDVGPKR
jgi:hypothetical protein